MTTMSPATKCRAISLTKSATASACLRGADDYVNGNPAFGYIFYSKLSFQFGNIESSFDEDISLYVLK